MRFRRKQRTSIDLPWINLSTLLLLWGAVSPLIALWLRDSRFLEAELRQDGLIYVGVATLATTGVFLWFRLSHSVSRFFSVADAVIILKASGVAVLLTLIICFLLTRLDNIPRSTPVLHFIVLAGGTIVARGERYFRRRRRDRIRNPTVAPENIIIIGVSDLSWFYVQIIEEFAADSYNLVAFLDESRTLQGRFVHGYPVAGRVSDIGQVIDEYEIHGVHIDRVILASKPQDLPREIAERVFLTAEEKSIPVDVLPERLGLGRMPSREPARSIEENVQTRYEATGTFWRTKRWFDAFAALALLIAAAPVALIVSVLVLIDCGMPVIFWQVRIGRFGDRITVYKFRTLRAPYNSRGQLVPKERRVSWIGSFLRFCHIDELPQLISILVGDMSFIGPRPLLPIDLSAEAGLRFAVRPGITGWAQVNGATLLSVDEKNAMDEWYVRHASWKLELLIALRTVQALYSEAHRNEAAIAEALAERDERLAAPVCAKREDASRRTG